MDNIRSEGEDLEFLKEGIDKYEYVRSENYFQKLTEILLQQQEENQRLLLKTESKLSFEY